MIKSLASGQKPALIINEVQVGLLDPEHAIFPALAEIAKERNIVANIAELIAAFRAKGHPIFYTPAVNRPDMADKKINTLISAISSKLRNMVTDSPDIAHPAEIAPRPEDFVIQRGAGLIAFHGSALDLTLRRLGVETVVITGISTNVAITGLTMAAVEFGYHAVIPEDCIAGADREAHRIIVEHQLRMLATITSKDEVVAALA
jgi:nicotinamidase-related amidase